MKPTPPKSMVSACPVCTADMVINRLACPRCETRIETSLPIHPFFRLPEDLQDFVMTFLRCRGSIRDMEKALGISYPTVCKRLDLVNELLGNTQPSLSRDEILTRLENGEISAKQASELLKKRSAS